MVEIRVEIDVRTWRENFGCREYIRIGEAVEVAFF
jgi:hypothetical protein